MWIALAHVISLPLGSSGADELTQSPWVLAILSPETLSKSITPRANSPLCPLPSPPSPVLNSVANSPAWRVVTPPGVASSPSQEQTDGAPYTMCFPLLTLCLSVPCYPHNGSLNLLIYIIIHIYTHWPMSLHLFPYLRFSLYMHFIYLRHGQNVSAGPYPWCLSSWRCPHTLAVFWPVPCNLYIHECTNIQFPPTMI